MHVTNEQGLPQALVSAVTNDSYSKGGADFSVTELLQPPQKVQLERRYDDQLSEDAADRMWALIGQVAHGILERASSDDIHAIPEQRLGINITLHNDETIRVSGAMDRVLIVNDQGSAVLQDYKVTTSYGVAIEGGAKNEWVHQLNFYAAILRHHGYRIDDIQVVAIYRDWSKMEAKRRPQEYPQHQVQVLQVPVWGDDEAFNMLRKRAILHHENAKVMDAQLKPCTDEERWAKPGQVAVYKAGNKRAARVVNTVQDAVDWMVWRKIAPNNDIDGLAALARGEKRYGYYLEFRPPRYVRCENYCAAAAVCQQWRAQQAELEDAE